MTKIVLNSVGDLTDSTTAASVINSNFDTLEAAFDNTLSLNGLQPNQMLSNLDMNSHRILNLPSPVGIFDPVRLTDLNTLNGGGTITVNSIPAGGTSGQVLTKNSGTDFDAGWSSLTSTYFETRAAAQAVQIPAIITLIVISKFGAGYTRCDAPYVRGGTVVPFTDGLGNQWGLDVSGGKLEAYWFGVKQDGATDDTTAMQTALNASAGCELWVRGKIGVTATLLPLSNTSICGSNRHTAGFVVLGTTVLQSAIIGITDVSYIKIDNLYFSGNLIEPGAYSYGAVKFNQSITSPNMTTYSITNCYFENFKTSNIIGVLMASSASNLGVLGNILVANNYVFASASCAATNAQAGNNGNAFFFVLGNSLGTSTTQGLLYNVQISNNFIDGPGLGSAVMCFQNMKGISVIGNTTINMGQNTLPTDFNYTYLFYDSGLEVTNPNPRNISIVGNVGYRHHNNAVYFVGAIDSSIVGNSFQFTVTGGIEPTLPWGAAIALNGTRNITVTGNNLVDCFGIAVVSIGQPTNPADFPDITTISGNTIQNPFTTSATQVPYGVLLSGSSISNAAITNVVGNSIKVTGTNATGIAIVGAQIGNVKISDNLIETSYAGIQNTGTVNAAALELSNNRIYGTLTNYALDINLTSGPVFLNDNIIDHTSTTGVIGTVRLSGDIYINGMSIYKKTNAGECFSVTSVTNATCEGVRFPKCTSTFVTGSLGLVAPVHSGKIGDFVQALVPGEAGAAASKYIVTGWTCTGGVTWLPNRTLTGN